MDTTDFIPKKDFPRIGVVVPVYNEAQAILPFYRALASILVKVECEAEILFVDDGSRDNTREVIRSLRATDSRVRLIGFSRNFGKEAALSAGLDRINSDVVVPIDVDLQDPPELILDFLRFWREGHDVVFGVRSDRNSDTAFKRNSAKIFYRLFNSLTRDRIPKDTGDYRLMDRRVVEALRLLPERNRFMKGLFAWVGFRSVGVPYQRPPRGTGDAKIRVQGLWRLALDGITGFSTLPLRIWTYIGFVVACLALLFGVWKIVKTLLFGVDLPGYASTMVVILFLGGIQLISLGVIGEYLGRLFVEAKQRPLYLIDEEF